MDTRLTPFPVRIVVGVSSPSTVNWSSPSAPSTITACSESCAIGDPRPFSIKVETYGTGDPQAARDFVMDRFDFRPAEIIRNLDLLRPIYRQTTNYGHLGKPGLPWEA